MEIKVGQIWRNKKTGKEVKINAVNSIPLLGSSFGVCSAESIDGEKLPNLGLGILGEFYELVSKPDMVNKPPHYKDASGIECKEITCHRKMPFSLGNAIKYLYRAGSKGDLLEDLKKAEWYLRVAYLNSEALPVEVVRRLSEVAAVRKTEAGKALNLISRHQVLDAYRVVKSEVEQLEAGNE